METGRGQRGFCDREEQGKCKEDKCSSSLTVSASDGDSRHSLDAETRNGATYLGALL